MFSMIYVFVATSVVDFAFKNASSVVNFYMKKYNDKFETMKKELANTTKDITDNKVKKKTASITVTINVNSTENILGRALMDFITNNKNTTHVSYIRENFILNQKDVITIDDEIFAKMTQSSSADEAGNQSSTSTNVNSGAGSNGNQSAIVQVIEVYSFTKTTDELRNFLDNIKQTYAINVKNKLGNKRYYFNMHTLSVPMDIDKRKDLSRLPPHFVFVMKHFQTNRKFSNLFGEDIEIIRNRVNFFCKNRKWYDEKGIPYTLGLLLSGSPGTGKTSTIKCLANETNRHICNVNLNNDMSKTQLENLFFNENISVLNPISGQHETYCIPLDQRIYVLEDVDCQSDMVMERTLKSDENKSRDGDKAVLEHYEDKHKVDLSFLLNLLDGVLENPGRIVIMTSNHPDTLDSALIRPGRIDVIAKFKHCSNKTVIEMIEFFYDTKLSQDDIQRIHAWKEEIITPAELSKIMFEHFSDVQYTIAHVENLSNQKVAEESVLEFPESNSMEASEEEKETSIPPDPKYLPIAKQLPPPWSIGAAEAIGPPPWVKEGNVGPLETLETLETLSKETVGPAEATEPPKDYASIVDKHDDERTMHSKAKHDFTYSFMTTVLPQYASKENIAKKKQSYYYNLLENHVFTSVRYSSSYKAKLQELKVRFHEIMTGSEYLDTTLYNVKNKPRTAIACEYNFQISKYFTSEFMMHTGLKGALINDHIIELDLQGLSQGFISKPSGASYSAFSAY